MDQQLVWTRVHMERACRIEQRLLGAGHRHRAHGLEWRHIVQRDRRTGDRIFRSGQHRGHRNGPVNVAGVIHGDDHARCRRRRLGVANHGGEPTGRLWRRGADEHSDDDHDDDKYDDHTATSGNECHESHDDTYARTATDRADLCSSHHCSPEAERARFYRDGVARGQRDPPEDWWPRDASNERGCGGHHRPGCKSSDGRSRPASKALAAYKEPDIGGACPVDGRSGNSATPLP